MAYRLSQFTPNNTVYMMDTVDSQLRALAFMCIPTFENTAQCCSLFSQKTPKASRMLMLQLTDGSTEVKAMEYQSIPQLSTGVSPGAKVCCYALSLL